MYGDEFLENSKKIETNNLSNIPSSNKDRCNPLYRVHKNEWVSDKNERNLNKVQDQKKKDTVIKLPIHELEAKLKLIQQIHKLRELKTYGYRTTDSEGAVSG